MRAVLPMDLSFTSASVNDWCMSPYCINGPRPKFIKVGDDLLRTNPPHRAKFRRARPYDVWEKRYKLFLHLSVFWHPVLGQSSSIWVVMYSKAPLLICQISFRSETSLRDICCQISSISWTAWLTLTKQVHQWRTDARAAWYRGTPGPKFTEFGK